MSDRKYPFVATIADLAPRIGTSYPAPFDEPCRNRARTRLGDAVGLTQFGVNLLVLPAGTWSAQRHWHEHEDEFILVLEGEVTLITDGGETRLRPGDAVGFPAGYSDAHHLRNDGEGPASVFEVGSRAASDIVSYPDIDLTAHGCGGSFQFLHKNGEPCK